MSFPGNLYSGSLIAICGVYEYSQQIIRAEGDLTDPPPHRLVIVPQFVLKHGSHVSSQPSLLFFPLPSPPGGFPPARSSHTPVTLSAFLAIHCVLVSMPREAKGSGVMSDSSHSWAFTSVTPDFLGIIVSCDYATYLCNPSLLTSWGP